MGPVHRLSGFVFSLTSSGNGADNGNGLPASVADVADAHDQIVLGLIGILGVVITALVYIVKSYGNSKTAAEQSTQTNEAVNHREHGEERLFEQVRTIGSKVDTLLKVQDKHQLLWDDHLARWGRLPEDLDDETDLIIALRDIHGRIDDVIARIDKLHPSCSTTRSARSSDVTA